MTLEKAQKLHKIFTIITLVFLAETVLAQYMGGSGPLTLFLTGFASVYIPTDGLAVFAGLLMGFFAIGWVVAAIVGTHYYYKVKRLKKQQDHRPFTYVSPKEVSLRKEGRHSEADEVHARNQEWFAGSKNNHE